ncbi:MAG TPA: proton-conducting transporter membrane subunit, partial [bacterium]|nr:proton-conducting transporter membrane subunit [bacterium]
MLSWTWCIPALPLAGFLVLAVLGGRMSKGANATVGAGSIFLSLAAAAGAAASFISAPPAGGSYTFVVWQWITAGSFSPAISFTIDALSVVMMLVVTGVGFLIHLYSTRFMADEEGYSRFFAYMNLFVGSMLILVMASNLLLLYLGWEGVGLCSFLLIGFWYKDPDNARSARKAFVVTRVGDVSLAIGLFILVMTLGTLEVKDIAQKAAAQWQVGSTLAIAVAALILGGAVGKSAQLPLQTWLPDAMAGPTPVSALIHAATMVTAGVYLIARTHVLFTLA